MRAYIAYCGLDCETCEARIATMDHDDVLRRKVAREWSELNGVEITPEMINCAGCRIDGVKTPYCDSLCPIRQCALARGVETCGSCEAMEFCEKLSPILKNSADANWNLRGYVLASLRDRPEFLERAAAWFHAKWGVPKQAYQERMMEYISGETEYGWYLCLDGECIVGGLGVIDNDFHDRPDLTPNVCAVYTEEAFRGRGIAGRLLKAAVEDMRAKGITPLYLVSDHVGFYERYGWEYLCMVHEDVTQRQTRMYIHR